MSDHPPEEVLARILHLRETRPDYRNLLELAASLYREMAAAEGQARPPENRPPSPETRLGKGFPLYPAEEPPVDAAAARRLLDAFLKVPAPDAAGLEAIAAWLGHETVPFADLGRGWLRGGPGYLAEALEGSGVDAGLLGFLLGLALQPSFAALRRRAAEVLGRAEWTEGFCPLCGDQPRMARLEGDGRRMLWCGRCGWEWRFNRIECPFCRATDQNSLYYLYDEGEEGYRVDACKVCKGYLKTVDARLRQAEPMELEDLVTMHLDLLAVERKLTARPRPRKKKAGREDA